MLLTNINIKAHTPSPANMSKNRPPPSRIAVLTRARCFGSKHSSRELSDGRGGPSIYLLLPTHYSAHLWPPLSHPLHKHATLRSSLRRSISLCFTLCRLPLELRLPPYRFCGPGIELGVLMAWLYCCGVTRSISKYISKRFNYVHTRAHNILV